MAIFRLTYWFDIVDIDGDVARTSVNTNVSDIGVVGDLDTNSNSLGTPLAAATNGKVIGRGCTILLDRAQLVVGSSPPADAIYPKVETGARLHFSNANGSRASWTVPAPKEAVFKTGGERNTVDPAATLSANLITAFEAVADDVGGNALNLYQGGVRTGKHARRRPSRRV
jgi:hypothetical protein